MKTTFHDATDPQTSTVYSFGAVLIHRSNYEERCIDIMTSGSDFVTVSAAIRRFYSSDHWGIYETWLHEDSAIAPITPALAA